MSADSSPDPQQTAEQIIRHEKSTRYADLRSALNPLAENYDTHVVIGTFSCRTETHVVRLGTGNAFAVQGSLREYLNYLESNTNYFAAEEEEGLNSAELGGPEET